MDQQVRVELGDRDVRIAKADGDHWNTGPARPTVCFRIAGSGLATPNVSAPQIAAKRRLNPNSSSRRLDSHSSLLVHTARRQPFSVRPSSACSRPSKGREATAMWEA